MPCWFAAVSPFKLVAKSLVALRALIISTTVFFCSCHSSPTPARRQVTIGWRPVASWAGGANYQTDSFNIETGQWRIKWDATEQPGTAKKVFRVIVHSSVSGRYVITSVDHPSAGHGIAYLAEDPRDFFLVIESNGIDWKLTVEEGTVEN